MWRVRYNNSGHPLDGFFSVSGTEEEDNRSYQPEYHDFFPLANGFESLPLGIKSVYDTKELGQSDSVPDVDSETFSWVKVNGDGSTLNFMTEVNSLSMRKDGLPGLVSAQVYQQYEDNKFQTLDDDQISEESGTKPKPESLVYGNHWEIFWAVTVRVLLIGHNVLTVWRVVEVYNSHLYWLITLANAILLFELHVVIVKRAGMDYSWWTPSFLIYLSSTIPAIWLLQLQLYDAFIAETTVNPAADTNHVTGSVNVTPSTNASLTTAARDTSGEQNTRKLELDNNVWIIIIQESLVYLLVFSRWLLPRGNVSRTFLADLLLEFLAIASDIMELLVVFEEDEIRGNLSLTYVIMAVWSASFIQFIPVLMHKRRFRHVRNPRIKCITRMCGEKFVEIVVTCMNILLQDLPFLIVRLYVIFKVQIITYSLIFFVLKNFVTLLLLCYRLVIICRRLPCFRRNTKSTGDTPEKIFAKSSSSSKSA